MLPLDVLPRLTAATALTSWRLDVFALGFVVLAAAGYLYGIRRAARRGRRWAIGRTACFFGIGLGAIVLATMSALAVYAKVLFWPATTSNIILDLLAPIGLAVGDPFGLARAGSGPAGAARLDRLLGSPLLRFWTFPLVSSAAVLASELSIYFTPYFTAALAHEPVWQLMHLQLLGTGLMFVLPMLTSQQLLPRWCTPGLRVLLVFLDGLFDSVPGLLIMVSPRLLAESWYGAQQRSWGPDLRLDQQIAGGLLFALAEAVAFPFLIVVFAEWWRSERTKTAELDARLDREAAESGGEELARPWWETDTRSDRR